VHGLSRLNCDKNCRSSSEFHTFRIFCVTWTTVLLLVRVAHLHSGLEWSCSSPGAPLLSMQLLVRDTLFPDFSQGILHCCCSRRALGSSFVASPRMDYGPFFNRSAFSSPHCCLCWKEWPDATPVSVVLLVFLRDGGCCFWAWG